MGNLQSGTRVYGTFTSDTSIGYTPGISLAKSVTQIGSRTTAVNIDAPTGSIKMYSAGASNNAQSFTVNNTFVASHDLVMINPTSGVDTNNYYFFNIKTVTTGSFAVNFYAPKGNATDAPVLQFALFKGAVN
jgi:hypothetical protein